MKYTINIESSLESQVFRLNNELVWQRCNNTSILNETDFQTLDAEHIISLQKQNIKLTIEGQEFEVESETGSWDLDETQLHYHIYGFRENFPTPPDENQLLNLLENGDDSVRNTLVLKTDGLFYLLQQNQILHDVKNPYYVLQFPIFQAHQDYVGQSIRNDGNRNYVQNIFKTSIEYWIKHLTENELHNMAEIDFDSDDQVEGIITLFGELNQIRNNWNQI